MWKRREVAVACLAVGSVGQLVQFLVTPVDESGTAAENVAKAVAHPAAMRAAAWLDLTILFFLPAIVVVAYLARARSTRLGWVAAVLTIGTTVPGIAYVLAPDILYVGAIHGDVTPAAITAYTGNGVVGLATILFLIGHVLGLLLLGIALWRAGSVPRWAGICLALSPFLEVGGAASGVKPVGALAYVLLTAAFAACVAAITRRADAPASEARTATASAY